VRRVVYSVAASLDGYIAGPGDDFDWIPREPAIDWDAFMERFDTVLMGRRTYEVVAAHGPGASLPQLPTYVFSRTLQSIAQPNVTLVGDDALKVVRELRKASGKEIWLMGGGVLCASLLEAGLVDAVEVGLVPIILGDGLPFLPPVSRRIRLTLTGTQEYPSGIVLLSYVVRSESA
jgi:dihydrofolate reductase